MMYLSCCEIYQSLNEQRFKQTATREYAYEFQLKNGQYIYVKRLSDTKKLPKEPSRLMIHPAFIVLKEDLEKLENVEFSFCEEGNMSTAFARFPKCSKSQCDDNPTEYGIGVNFRDKTSLYNLLKVFNQEAQMIS